MSREIEFRALYPDGTWAYMDVSKGGYMWSPSLRTMLNKKTLGQYTGIKDANGVKVFEGDVCEDGDGDIFVVAWSKMSAMFLFYFPGGLPDDALCDAIEPFKVIGNIHQHPELLEGER